jgi:hypothetical protein
MMMGSLFMWSCPSQPPLVPDIRMVNEPEKQSRLAPKTREAEHRAGRGMGRGAGGAAGRRSSFGPQAEPVPHVSAATPQRREWPTSRLWRVEYHSMRRSPPAAPSESREVGREAGHVGSQFTKPDMAKRPPRDSEALQTGFVEAKADALVRLKRKNRVSIIAPPGPLTRGGGVRYH